MKNITAGEEYAKNPKINQKDVLEIIEWARNEPHLPEITEFQVIQILHACYYDKEKSKQSVDLYFKYRTIFTDLFTNMDVRAPEIIKAMNTITIVLLPGTTPEGYRVVFWKWKDREPANFDHANCAKLYAMFCETMVYELGTCRGYICLLDFYGSRWGHILKLNLRTLMHTLKFVQDALPIRLLKIEHVRLPFDKPITMAAPFIKPELLHKLKFRKHMRDVEGIPLEMLPCEYPGGKGPPLEELRNKWIKLIDERREHFLKAEVTQRSDESKRIVEKKSWHGLW